MSRTIRESEEVILDPFCLIRLHASGHAEEILRASSLRFAVDGYVLRNEPARAREAGLVIGTDPLVRRALGAGLLRVVELESDAEALTYIELSPDLDDGEARACALAFHRAMALAADGQKAQDAVKRLSPNTPLLGTHTLLRLWVDHAGPLPGEIAAALRRIRDTTAYEPTGENSMWWQSAINP